MTKKLKWKDYEPDKFCSRVAEAHASRAVGGKYRIGRCEGTFLNRPTGNVWFEVERLVNNGPGAWNNDLVKNNHPIARTLEQAKQVAEIDNRRRLDEAKAETVR
jgi:hypothetical protein